MTALWLSLLSIVATCAGGLCALAWRRRLDRVLGFTAGAVLGLVCFELLPEILDLASQAGADGRAAIAALAGGFLVVHGLPRPSGARRHEKSGCRHGHGESRAGVLHAAALVGHSFIDGLGIGLAFQVSEAAGAAVAIAVIAHDFCDGLNTVGVVLAARGTASTARRMLVLDALAPAAGAAASLVLSVPPQALGLLLAFFAGMLLYVGGAGVLPRAWAPGAAGSGRGFVEPAVLLALGAMSAGAVRFVAI